MRLSPTLHKHAIMYNSETIVEDNIDFWYDSLNDCYENNMPIEMVCTYVEAIMDEDTECESQSSRLSPSSLAN